MDRDGLIVGVRIRKVLILSMRMLYRSVKNHPFFVGIFLLLLILYRSSPFLFSLLVSASPVLVCTAVLLGALLSFGDSNVSLVEEDERASTDIVHLKMGIFENTNVVEKDESSSSDRFTELRREIVERNLDYEPLLDGTDRVNISGLDGDVDVNSMLIDQNLRQISFDKELIDEACIGVENLEIEQQLILDGKKIPLAGDEVSSSHDQVVENRLSGVQSENFEDYKSAEGSVDAQISEELESSVSSWKRFDEVLEDKLSPVQKFQAAVHAQIRNQLESSFRSWKQLDKVVVDRLPSAQKVKTENFEDYRSVDGSLDTHIRDQLESSLGSRKQLDSDHDGDDESDSGSDGAESSSPDASLADIIPMLDELHPLLEDENPPTVDLSHQISAAMMARSEKSHDGSVHSDDESDQKEGDEEAGDVKSDGDDDDDEDEDDEEETQGSKDDPAKSAISWTEDDQKNLMDLGTSELERNQRLESLIARRRARRNMGMVAERNLIDLDGMDLQYQIAPISTSRRNPFDLPNDSYDDLGLPPIPGSAPSVLAARRNPFDLPYDSSEEKPDLMGDSFQQEFMELNQREASYQKEPVFRRNETFSMGSSIFDFGRHVGRNRASRFRPYFVPERTDSDSFSYSSLQRQFSELSESKLSSAAETESTSAFDDDEAKKRIEHEISQEIEPSSEIEHASLYVEHGSESFEDVHSLSDQESDHEEVILNEPESELGRTENCPAATSPASETGRSVEIRLNDGEKHPAEESIKEEDATSCSSSSLSDECNDMKVEDEDEGLISGEQIQVNVESVDALVVNPLQASVSTISAEYLHASEHSHSTELDEACPKEPVYDLSPHSSSISSDLLVEMSGVDSYHLSTVQRDLFVSDESKDHKEHAEQNALDEKEDTVDNSLTVKQSVEDNGHDDLSEFQFPVATQHPVTLEALVAPQYEVNLTTNSLNEGPVNDELLNAKDYSDGGQGLNQEVDDAGVYMEGKVGAVESENDISSAADFKPSEDISFGPKERDISALTECVPPVQSELLYAEVKQREESALQKKEDHQFLASTSDSKNNDNNVDEMLVTPLDEAHQFLHDAAIHNPYDKSEEKEPFTIHRKLEEVEVENIYETGNTTLVQEPEEFKREPVTKLADEEQAHYNELGVSGSDGKVLFDLIDIHEMDVDLLSELDAVGDFSVKDTGSNLNADIVHMNAEVDSSLSQQGLDEAYSSTGMPFIHDTMLEDSAFVENSEAMREITQPSIPSFEESHLDSHTRDANTGLLVLEAASVEDIDAAFLGVSEEEVQKSVTAESLAAELTREQVEASYQETELFRELTEQVFDGTEEVSLRDVASVNRESVAESTATDITSVDEEICERADENFQTMVETEAEAFSHVESLPTAGKTELDTVESAPLQIDRNMKEIHEPLFVEESITSAFEPSTQVERGVSMESESLQIDAEIKDCTDPAVESEHQTERIGFVESEPLNIDREIKERHESPSVDVTPAVESAPIDRDIKENQELAVFEANIACSVDSNDQTERFSSLESESLLLDGDIKEIPDRTEIPSVESLITNRDIEDVPQSPVLEESITPRAESVGHVDSGSLLTARDSVEVREASVVEASAVPALMSEEDRAEKVGSVESNLLQIGAEIKDIQESPVKASSESVVETEDHIEDTQRMEVAEVQAAQDHQFPAQQQCHDLTEADSVTTVIESTGNGSSSQGENKEGESNKSPPEFSSSSTPSSSS